MNFVSPEYFPVLQIPLAQGRLWDGAETRRGAQLAVINQTHGAPVLAEGRRDRPPVSDSGHEE